MTLEWHEEGRKTKKPSAQGMGGVRSVISKDLTGEERSENCSEVNFFRMRNTILF